MLASLRNIPVLMWNASADELVPPTSYLPTADELDRLGYRYELDVYTAEHLTLAIHDQYAPAAEFLGTAKVNRNPAHVTYVVNPSLDQPDLGYVADHAYWLSNISTRGAGQGTRRRGLARATAPATRPPPRTQTGTGTLGGGNLGTLAFTRQYKTWGDGAADPEGEPHRPHRHERLVAHDQPGAREGPLQRRPADHE